MTFYFSITIKTQNMEFGEARSVLQDMITHMWLKNQALR